MILKRSGGIMQIVVTRNCKTCKNNFEDSYRRNCCNPSNVQDLKYFVELLRWIRIDYIHCKRFTNHEAKTNSCV